MFKNTRQNTHFRSMSENHHSGTHTKVTTKCCFIMVFDQNVKSWKNIICITYINMYTIKLRPVRCKTAKTQDRQGAFACARYENGPLSDPPKGRKRVISGPPRRSTFSLLQPAGRFAPAGHHRETGAFYISARCVFFVWHFLQNKSVKNTRFFTSFEKNVCFSLGIMHFSVFCSAASNLSTPKKRRFGPTKNVVLWK